jgi:hypothetical protein
MSKKGARMFRIILPEPVRFQLALKGACAARAWIQGNFPECVFRADYSERLSKGFFVQQHFHCSFISTAFMQTWSVMYTMDGRKGRRNRQWSEGSLDYNTTTHMAHFYSEDRELLGTMKLAQGQVVADAEVSLFGKVLIEISNLQSEYRNSDEILAQDAAASSSQIPGKKDIPGAEASDCQGTAVSFDTLYTRDKEKTDKRWNDGFCRFYSERKLIEFFDSTGKSMHRKQATEVPLSQILSTAYYLIEIIGPQQNSSERREVGSSFTTAPSHSKENSRPGPVGRLGEQKSHLSAAANASGTCNLQKFAIVYTADKHKKQNKKWLDGRLHYDPARSLALFYGGENDALFYKKIMTASTAVTEGAEFDSGQYQFVVCEEVTDTPQAGDEDVPDEQPTLKRTRMESRLGNDPISASGRLGNGSMFASGQSENDSISASGRLSSNTISASGRLSSNVISASGRLSSNAISASGRLSSNAIPAPARSENTPIPASGRSTQELLALLASENSK